MRIVRSMGALGLAMGLLGAQQVPEDPVMKARAERAQSQGISEGDLPPVPRGITEPPPLPPPELHVKDARRGKSARKPKKAKGKGASAKAKTPAKAKTSAKTSKTKP